MRFDLTWSELTGRRKQALLHWLRTVHSPASLAKAEIWLGGQAAYLDIRQRWDGMEPHERQRGWDQLQALYRAAAYASRRRRRMSQTATPTAVNTNACPSVCTTRQKSGRL